MDTITTASDALNRLKEDNKSFLNAKTSGGNISQYMREFTCTNGQKPFAVIIACSDSRVIPEAIFNAGIGELFVIRVAGNVIDNHQLGSIEYAVDHLGCPLVVVLGHTHCGAIDAAIHHSPDGHIKHITDEILKAVGTEIDDYNACCLNTMHSVKVIESNLDIRKLEQERGVKVCGAVYHIDSGWVEFLDNISN